LKINTKSLLYGTLVLTVANFVVRLLGFVYRVILSRLIGPQGMGLMQLIFPVFHIAVTLTTAGLPTAVSRLVSEKKAKGDLRGIRRTVAVTLMLVAGISFVITLVALFNLDYIAENIIGDGRTRGALFVLFPCIMIIGLGASLKGFFYGMKDVHPPALAEIIEQLTRMALAASLLYWFAPKGNYALAVAIVMLGTVFGELSSLLFLHYRYYKTTKAMYNAKPSLQAGSNKILRVILAIALPITATRLINSLMNAVNSIMIPQRLVAGGMLREEAIGMYGILSGMVMPVLFLPFTITNALTVVIIPNLSENLALKNWKEIRDKVYKAILITCLTAFPATALMVSLGKPIGDVLYHQPMAGTFLVPISYALVFHALQHTCSGILNGLGKQTRGAAHFLIGSIIQLLCTYFLLADPTIRVYGIIIGVILNSCVVCTCNLTTVLKTIKMPFHFLDWILKPGFSGLLTALACNIIFKSLSGIHAPVTASLVISGLTGLFIFFLSLRAINGLPAELIRKPAKGNVTE
jgi:stage V sporulation protein B